MSVTHLKNCLANIILIMTLSGCAFMGPDDTPEPPQVDTSYIDDAMVCKIPIDIPQPSSIHWRDLQWYVLNKEKVQDMIDNGEDIYYIALTPEGYERLSLNVDDIRSYMSEQKEIINSYQKYYQIDEPSQNDE